MDENDNRDVVLCTSPPPIDLTSLCPSLPVGLSSLYTLCKRIYPDQCNPLQATAMVKWWLGGPDPLDYISMYDNPGDRMIGIPPHWHYIGFGLSNLHGDCRVHKNLDGPDGISGFGFELTFRLLKDPEVTIPPVWPIRLLQFIARYIFTTGNTFYVGDHLSWNKSLDNKVSRVQHLLMGEDPQLQVTVTPYGSVRFIQILGIFQEELQAVQRWNGPGVLQIMKRHSATGGPWLITNMYRDKSMFEVSPSIFDEIAEGIRIEGSNLCGISAHCSWEETVSKGNKVLDMMGVEQSMNNLHIILIHSTDKPTVDSPTFEGNPNCNHQALAQERFVENVHLKFNLEYAPFLLIALQGRIRHGRHFTFKGMDGKITFVASSVSGSLVTDENPYACLDSWLQVLVPNNFITALESSLKMFVNEPDTVPLPKTIEWPDRKLTITINPNQT